MADNIISMAEYLRAHPQGVTRTASTKRKKRDVYPQQSNIILFPRRGPRRPAA